jgi:hypothetical protein
MQFLQFGVAEKLEREIDFAWDALKFGSLHLCEESG